MQPDWDTGPQASAGLTSSVWGSLRTAPQALWRSFCRHSSQYSQLLLKSESAQLLKAGFQHSAHWAHPVAALVAFSLDVVKPAYPRCPGWVAGGAFVAFLSLVLIMKYWKGTREIGSGIIAFFLATTVLSTVVIGAETFFGGEDGSVAERIPYVNDLQKDLGIKVSLSLANPEVTAKLTGVRSAPSGPLPPPQQITYDSKQESGSTHVTYRLPYLDLVRQGGPVSGLTYDRVPFEGELPELLVTVLNNTKHNVVLTAAVLNIQSSRIVSEAIPVFDDLSQDCLRISNQGWADIVNPVVRFTISRDTGEVALFAPERHSLPLQTIADSKCIPMRDYVQGSLRHDRDVKVSGVLEYGVSGDRHSLAFATRVKLQLRAGESVPPDALYDVFFKAGEAGRVATNLQPAQQVKADEAAAFVLRLRTDRTSETNMTIDFQTIDSEVIQGRAFTLDLFVPRLETQHWKVGGVRKQ
jgi:hypothetical protein